MAYIILRIPKEECLRTRHRSRSQFLSISLPVLLDFYRTNLFADWSPFYWNSYPFYRGPMKYLSVLLGSL